MDRAQFSEARERLAGYAVDFAKAKVLADADIEPRGVIVEGLVRLWANLAKKELLRIAPNEKLTQLQLAKVLADIDRRLAEDRRAFINPKPKRKA